VNIVEELRDRTIVAVVRAPDPTSALAGADALVRGGVSVIEVTYSTPEAPTVIARLRERYGDDAVVGAGTVTTKDEVQQAVECGAQFLVSPGTDVNVAIHDRFVESVKDRFATLRVGHALDEETVIGPVVDQRQLDQDLEYIAVASAEGGKVFGGERVQRPTEGFYLSPALVTGTTNDMRINREEVFGPVASVVRVPDYSAALAAVNDTDFGLSAGHLLHVAEPREPF